MLVLNSNVSFFFNNFQACAYKDFLAISGDMRFPSIYVFTLFLIPSLYGDQNDGFCETVFKEEYPSFSCEPSSLTNLTKESGKCNSSAELLPHCRGMKRNF